MSILWYILVGAVVGVIARVLLPGKENMGWFMTVVLGALGAFLAGAIGDWLGWYTFPSWLGFVASIVLAIILVGIYARMKGKR